MPWFAAFRAALSNRHWNDFTGLGFDCLVGAGVTQGCAIIDVGANHGQWSAAARRFLSPTVLHVFEPLPRAFNELENTFSGVDGVSLHHCALSNRDGSAEFHVTRNDDCSSLLPPLDEMKAYYGNVIAADEVIQVETRRLDDVDLPEKIDLMKIDVQGAELDVIDGATRVLSRTRVVMIEANFRPHYAGGSTFDAVHARLTSLGFVLHRYGRGFSSRDEMLWMDAVYLHR